MQFVWLVWSLLLLIPWGLLYFFIQEKELKKKMFQVSAWTALIGLTEPFFVPAYWTPPSLFDLALKTGFDIESIIFSFGLGGLAFVLYYRIFKSQKMQGMPPSHRHHRYHLLVLLSAPIIFVILLMATALNPLHVAIIAMIAGGVATLFCRPDLKNKMLVSAVIFLGLYFVYFLILIAISPSYVERVWNLSALSGLLLFGIPLEELFFALSFGFIWSSIYEHFEWRRLVIDSRHRQSFI